MVIVLRAILSLFGLLFVFVGTGFLLDPVGSGQDFGLIANGPQGLASIRGDMTAFFWVSGGCLLLGAWSRHTILLYVTAALMGIVFLARAFSLLLDGSYAGWFLPMGVEAVTVIAALAGARTLARSGG